MLNIRYMKKLVNTRANEIKKKKRVIFLHVYSTGSFVVSIACTASK